MFATKHVPAFWQVILLTLAGWMLFNLYQTVGLIVGDYSALPITDYWRIPQYWSNWHSSHLATLWVQHNEHRIVFPEIVFATDALFFHGRMYLPIAVSGLCYLGIWAVLVWTAYATPFRSPLREISLLIAGIVIAWQGCSSTIASPFQLQFTLFQFATAVAFALLAKLAETARQHYLAGLIVAAVVVNYSSANGMLLWPILIVAGVLLRLRSRQIIILTGAAVLPVAAYFIHYHFLPSLISRNIKHPEAGLGFLGSYMGMPFGTFFAPSFGVTVGLVNLALMSLCTLIAWRRGLFRYRLGMLVFGFYAFTALSAVLTTLGRMDPADPTFRLAKAWRYITVPMIGWALLSIAVLWILDAARSRALSLTAALILCSFFGYGFVKARRWVGESRQDFRNAQITAIMLQNGVFDPDQIGTDFPDPEFVRSVLKDMKQSHSFLYAPGEQQLPVANVRLMDPSTFPASGLVTHMFPVVGGVELVGWTDAGALTRDAAVLFVDANHHVIGFGKQPGAGVPAAVSSWDTPGAMAWVGFVPLQEPSRELTAYARSSNGRSFQPIEGAIQLPTFLAKISKSDAAPIEVKWKMDKPWSVNGYPPSVAYGIAPKGPIYGSGRGEAAAGTLQSNPFDTPADHCMVLPVLLGASAYRQSVRVLDADTKQTIANLPTVGVGSIWRWWQIPIPLTPQHLDIEASDQGIGPNHWMAVATPQRCR